MTQPKRRAESLAHYRDSDWKVLMCVWVDARVEGVIVGYPSTSFRPKAREGDLGGMTTAQKGISEARCSWVMLSTFVGSLFDGQGVHRKNDDGLG
jgi:hypothetical protein